MPGGRPLTVLRGDGWEVAARPPHPALRGHVRRLVGFTERSAAPMRRLELPSSTVTVIVGFAGSGWGIDLPWAPGTPHARHGAFAAGLHGTAAVTEQAGPVAGVQADLTPAGAQALLAVAPGELAGRVAALEDAMGGDAATRSLAERLAAADGWPARLDLVEAWLARRAERARRPVAPAVAWALTRLQETGGGLPVGALCEELGWSRRHLAARFRAQVGVTPKALARLVRFERAAGALAATGPGGADLARVALDCGYYDQAHFTREFRAFAGLAPGAYLAARGAPGGITAAAIAEVTSVQDPAAAPG